MQLAINRIELEELNEDLYKHKNSEFNCIQNGGIRNKADYPLARAINDSKA